MQFLNKQFIVYLLLSISIIANIALGVLLANAMQQVNQQAQVQQVNVKILSFTSLFIEKILLSDKDVDFNTRLTLETIVRNLNNPDILAQWQRFTGASDSQAASTEAKKLLDLLVHKVVY